MRNRIRSSAVLIMGSILLLPFLATIMIFSSSGADDDDTGSVFLAQVDNSFLRNETGKNVEAIFSLVNRLMVLPGAVTTTPSPIK